MTKSIYSWHALNRITIIKNEMRCSLFEQAASYIAGWLGQAPAEEDVSALIFYSYVVTGYFLFASHQFIFLIVLPVLSST